MNTVTQMNNNAATACTTAMQQVLADTFAIYAKTHSFHWNVEGMHFHSLHTLFEEQYTEMWNSIDEIAERIRSFGAYAPWNYGEMLNNTNIEEAKGYTSAEDMVKTLVLDHQLIITSLKGALAHMQDAEDEVSTDLIIGRLAFHEKTLWMLTSLSK